MPLRVMTLLLLAVPAAVPQDPAGEFQKRVRLEANVIRVDDKVLYEGPWKKARVRVEEFNPFGKDSDFVPWKQVVLTVDGSEVLRVPVPSIEKPILWPPIRHEEVRPVIRKLTQGSGEEKSFVVFVVTAKGQHPIYQGPVAETRMERKMDSFAVLLKGQVLYRVTRSRRPPVRPEGVLGRINRFRTLAGLAPAALSGELSKGCDLHALYIVKNRPKGLSAHDEDPKGLGYTEEGARAGPRSVISAFASYETPLDALDSLMATLYHRVALLHPRLSEVGIGWAYRKEGPGHLVIDVATHGRPVDSKKWPVVYPAPGQKDVPPEFGLGSRETPNPLPPGVRTGGYPITIQYPPLARPHLSKPKLLAGTTVIPCWVSTPEVPAREDRPQPGVICLIAKRPLRPGTTYIVRLRDRLTGEAREWTFNTSKEGD